MLNNPEAGESKPPSAMIAFSQTKLNTSVDQIKQDMWKVVIGVWEAVKHVLHFFFLDVLQTKKLVYSLIMKIIIAALFRLNL